MGYTTDFEGRFHCCCVESPELVAFLKAIQERDLVTMGPLGDWLLDRDPVHRQVQLAGELAADEGGVLGQEQDPLAGGEADEVGRSHRAAILPAAAGGPRLFRRSRPCAVARPLDKAVTSLYCITTVIHMTDRDSPGHAP